MCKFVTPGVTELHTMTERAEDTEAATQYPFDVCRPSSLTRASFVTSPTSTSSSTALIAQHDRPHLDTMYSDLPVTPAHFVEIRRAQV